jgi:hypothetical protein
VTRLWRKTKGNGPFRRREDHRAPAKTFLICLTAAVAVAAVAWPLVASGHSTSADTVSATFANSAQVSFTLQGCRLPDSNHDGKPDYTLPLNGKFVCNDGDYTTGNLGKSWNELDLVPHRLTTNAGTQAGVTTDYNVIIAADNCNYTTTDNGFTCVDTNVGSPGYDFISIPVVNTAKSDTSCSVSASDPVSYAGNKTTAFGGGTDIAIYRTLTIHQSAGTTCVFDYYERLALGSHLFSGSSLQSYMFEDSGFSVGKKTISIPVNEISPQALNKDMEATQNTDHTWDVTKDPTPAELSFGNTCDPDTPKNLGVSVSVTWTKNAATPSGDITVTTHVYATNPANRTVTATVSDVIYRGTTPLDTASSTVDVPADTNLLVLTHSVDVASGTANLNDIATGTYTDAVTGIPIPGSTKATASATVQPSGIDLDSSAVITDSESITTGANLQFSTDSFSGASGSFDSGYVAGTKTTGPVGWTSVSQTGSGGVTFSKTVYVDPGVTTSGKLTDTATVTGSDGFTTSADGKVTLDAHPLVSLKITKTISAKSGSSQTFYFDVSGLTPSTGNALTIPAGSTSNSITLTGLEPGTYKVHEQTPPAPWTAPADQSTTINASDCSGGVTMANTFAPATAQVKKVTDPSGHEGGWTFTLNGSDGTSESVATTNASYVPFTTQLVDGVTYTITETAQTDWDLTQVTGSSSNTGASSITVPTTPSSCSFTPHYFTNANDLGNVFSCTFKNVQRGTIIVKKVTSPAGGTGFTFTGDAAGTIGDGGSITVSHLKPGKYSSTEAAKTGWDLTSVTCDDGTSTTPSTGDVPNAKATFNLDPGETVTCTFKNTQRGKAKVVKTVNGQTLSGLQSFVFELRQGASAGAAGTILETGTANAADSGVITFSTYLVPGTTYQLCEQMQPGWLTTLGPPLYSVYNPSGDNSVVCTDFTVTAGQTKTFAIDNKPPPGGMALTIGFWKNWASCAGSSGKQKPVLDQTLLAASNAGHAITIGTLVLDPKVLGATAACQDAVNILNKSTLSGKKMSSDPLFNMAAQLLAANLNVAAGAGSCASAASAINAAQALLLKYKFDGNGYTGKLSTADATLANSLATTLDQYNNNQLC